MVLTAGRAIGVPSIAFRYQNVYGPGQSLSNPYTGILSIFSSLIKTNNSINIFEDGKESRDFVYINDVVDATITGLESSAGDFQTFNVGSGVATSVLDVAQTLCEKFGAKKDIRITGDYRIGDIRHNRADLSKIQSLLNFQPKWRFDEGIGVFCGWVSSQRGFTGGYLSSINEMKAKRLLKSK
jgi:dTDP-L-rhamnose 4-epimerase